jgi:hypothetical protein
LKTYLMGYTYDTIGHDDDDRYDIEFERRMLKMNLGKK